MIKTIKRFAVGLVLSMPLMGNAENFSHNQWQQILSQQVVTLAKTTQVNYRAIVDQPQPLEQYLQQLAEVTQSQFDAWPKQEQLAFLINAYNAWTVKLIIDNYPVESIRELGSWLRSPWKREFIDLFGKKVSLDYIEHDLIRAEGVYQEPRIHFAVNCASIGCPPLRAEAYTGEKLERQLQEQTEIFLSNRTQNRLEDDKLVLSSIFKWYQEDFEKGWGGYQRLEDFLLAHSAALNLNESAKAELETGKQSIRFVDYDWRLNGISARP